MPTYTYTCPKCGHVDKSVLISAAKIRAKEDTRKCSKCGEVMARNFPAKVHTVVERSVDGRDVGKVIQEKNEKLKNKEAGYSHESKALRRDIEAKTQKIMENK